MMRGATQTQYDEREGLVALLESGLLTDRSVAIDGGAHVGTWTELLSRTFEEVHAFEPGPAFEFLSDNVCGLINVVCHNEALCDRACRVESYHRKPGGKLTSYRVRENEAGTIAGVTIDSLNLDRCGLIKLDVEGYEFPALLGARQTIERFRPFVLAELAGHGGHVGRTDRDVVDLLRSFGYREVWHWGVDFGFKWQGR